MTKAAARAIVTFSLPIVLILAARAGYAQQQAGAAVPGAMPHDGP